MCSPAQTEVHPTEGDAVPPEEFLSALQDTAGEKAARFNRRLLTQESGYPAVPTSTQTWLPDKLATEYGVMPTATLAVTLTPSVSAITVQAARLDLTAPIVWSDLALFSPDEPGSEPAPLEPLPGNTEW